MLKIVTFTISVSVKNQRVTKIHLLFTEFVAALEQNLKLHATV